MLIIVKPIFVNYSLFHSHMYIYIYTIVYRLVVHIFGSHQLAGFHISTEQSLFVLVLFGKQILICFEFSDN